MSYAKRMSAAVWTAVVMLGLVLASTAPAENTASAVPGPVASTKISEAYARLVARDAFFWAWPMVNVYNRRLAFKDLPEPGLMGGIVPIAPLNRLSMLTDYIEPEERLVACPNQDVVYGAGSIGLDNGQPFPSLNTMDKPLTHADGATDIDCGPSSPGAGKNGLKTLPDPGFFVMLQLYGPTQPFFDQTWKPSDLEKVP